MFEDDPYLLRSRFLGPLRRLGKNVLTIGQPVSPGFFMSHRTELIRLVAALDAKSDRHRAAAEALQHEATALRQRYAALEEAAAEHRLAVLLRWQQRRTVRAARALLVAAKPVRLARYAGAKARKADALAVVARLCDAAAEVDRGVFRSGVYALFDGTELVYVGQGANVAQRIAAHAGAGKAFTHAAYVPVAEQDLLRIERVLLDAFTPRLNRDTSTAAIRRRAAAT